MNLKNNSAVITEKAKMLFREERSLMTLKGWFYIKEIRKKYEQETQKLPRNVSAGWILKKIAEELPISVFENALFVGTQRDGFARSYALINPSFRVESFAGYCNPTAVFDDIEPDDELSAGRIEEVRRWDGKSEY